MKMKWNMTGICLLGAVLLQSFNSGAQPVTKIVAGASQSLFLKSDGSLWGMGYNSAGALGDSSYNNTNLPEQIMASGITTIAGYEHSLLLKSDGSLWGMGDNRYGQLGDGVFNTVSPYGTNRPQQIVASNVTAIAAGWQHSLFLKRDGSLWAMGTFGYGQSGDGTFNQTNRPELILASNVTAIAAGSYHSLFIKSDGSLWAMGGNIVGQLGDGTYTANPPFGVNHPELIIASNVTAIAAGGSFSLFCKKDGSLWGMGEGDAGQLGAAVTGRTTENGPTNNPVLIIASNVTAIAAGDTFSLFLKNDGSLWGMGGNQYGQLGDGTVSYGVYLPEQIVASGVTAVAAGDEYSLFLKSDGSLWGMGANLYGALGDGKNSSQHIPEQILGAYNQIAGQPLIGGNLQLSFVGNAGTNYALDHSFSLAPPNWMPQATNPANSFGALVFTNTPNPATNNFWRIRSVP